MQECKDITAKLEKKLEKRFVVRTQQAEEQKKKTSKTIQEKGNKLRMENYFHDREAEDSNRDQERRVKDPAEPPSTYH